MNAPTPLSAQPTVRLFFAGLPDAAGRVGIAAAAAAISMAPPARTVPPENFHMTLAFLGEIPTSRLPIVLDIGRAQRVERFFVKFDAYEYWPKPEVVVAAARAIPPALQLLWQQLHGGLAQHRWALDPKRLRPHVTLARKVVETPVFEATPSVEWPIHSFSLMRSDRRGARSVYTVVDTWSLLDNVEKT